MNPSETQHSDHGKSEWSAAASLERRIVVVGAGAVGGYVGGKLALAGHDVTLVDAWKAHVEAINRDGLQLSEPGAKWSVSVAALHADELADLPLAAADVVFICVKLYDTEWATRLIAPHLKPDGCVVTLQNSLVEGVVAAHVGWNRTLGCIGSGMYVALAGPGRVVRNKLPAGNGACVFYIGEAQGRVSPRVEQLARMLGRVDATCVTANLWGLRWAKLVANTMTSGLSAVCDMGLKQLFADPRCRRLMIQLAAEAIRVGAALKYETEEIFGLAPDVWLQADAGSQAALDAVTAVFQHQQNLVTDEAASGSLQDLRKGKPTEVDFMNGFVAAKGMEQGVPTPLHTAVCGLLREIEQGKAHRGARHLRMLEAC